MHGYKFVRNILSSGIGEHTDIEQNRRVILLNSISFVGIAMLWTLGTVAFFQENWIICVLDYIFGATLAAIVFNYRISRNYNRTANWGLFFVGLLFMFLFMTGGADNTGHLWFYTYPLVAAFLLGAKRGAIATLILFGVSIIYLLAAPSGPFFASYSNSFILRFIPSLLVVFACSYLFGSINENARKKLARKNVELEQKIAALKKVEAELSDAKEMAEKANHAKSEFLANMSHELRTPLNHIIGFTELVSDGSFGEINKTQHEYLTDVLTSSRHLLSLINDILDLSKVEAGKMELELSIIHVSSVIESCVIMIKEKALRHGITVSIEADEIPDQITADARKLKQILYNLLSNAAKFTPDGGSIRLKAERIIADNGHFKTQSGKMILWPKNDIREAMPNMGYILFSDTDTGIGVSPEEIERIFSPFEQADNSNHRRYQGTGLGLSLSKSLVEMHDGYIWAESKGIGKGSTFCFMIPASR